ncbi:MAG: hypothetical protein WBL19_00400 [Minisyncoccia bacterium]
MVAPVIRVRSWKRAAIEDRRAGLLGWIALEMASCVIDNVTLRNTADGRRVLAFPSRTAKNGEKHSIVRPLTDEVRVAIQQQVFEQLASRADFGAQEEFVP